MSYTHLAQEERFLIHKHLQAGRSYSEIGRDLGRHHTTISREVKRNTGGRGYRYKQANEFAKHRRSKASSVPRKMSEELWAMIKELLTRECWSPEQIAGRLALRGVVSISAKWIYDCIWADRADGGTLYQCLRRRGRKPNRRGRDGSGRGVIPGRVDITQRPAEVEEKNRVGDWEADTIVGTKHRGALVSLVERASKFVCLHKVGAKTAREVGDAILGCLGPVREVVHTITADNGKEFAGHSRVSEGLCAGFYFATPYRSWERGLNEHTNGLVREYFPKKRDLSEVDPEEVREVEEQLNTRPRKSLGYSAPCEVFYNALGRVGDSSSVIPDLSSWRE